MVITIEPKIEREKLLRLLGGGDRQQLSPSTRKKMSRWGAEMTELVEPWLSYEVLRLVETSETEITLEGDISFRSRKIARTLKGCSHAVVFAATIGPDIETRLAELQDENRFSDLYVLDAVGSVAVEDVVDQFQKSMSERLRSDRRDVTLRFSPGYCDWNIREQASLFRVFKGKTMPISLTANCLMQPRKSVSGLFGIRTFTGTERVWDENPCRNCSKRDCIARRHEA